MDLMPLSFPPALKHYLENNSPLPKDQAVDKARKTKKTLEGKLLLNGITPQRRDDLEVALYPFKRMFSPARNVPEDIWCEIFCRCLSASSRPGLNFSVAPLLLTRVCRGWKSIAIATPQLWNSIHADIPFYIYQTPTGLPHESLQEGPDLKKLDWKGKMLNDWLDRSGVLPLFVTLGAKKPSGNYHVSESTLDFVNRLEHNAHRLHSLEVTLSRFHDWYHRFMLLRAVPNLNEIIVNEVPVNIERGRDLIPWIDADVFRVPRLRKVSIGNLPRGTSSWTMHIPSNWRSLQCLHIGTPLRARSVLLILETLHDLIECSLGIAHSTEAVNHTTPIELPKLKSLSLVDEVGKRGTSSFLYQYLEIPVLTSLKFSAKLVNAKDLWSTANPILILLPRIRVTLNTLVLDFQELLYTYWSLEIFQALPSLRHLILTLPPRSRRGEKTYTEIHHTILNLTSPGPKILNVGLKPITILPNLQNLEFRGEMDVLPEHFRDIIFECLNPTRRDIVTLKYISAPFSERIVEKLAKDIRRHSKRTGVECLLESPRLE